MSGKSVDLSNRLLDSVLGGPTYSRPSKVYVALFKTPHTAAGLGTEMSGGGYARVEVDNTLMNWPAASLGRKTNGLAVRFPTATAEWGVVVAAAIFSSASGNDLMYYGTLVSSRLVTVGKSPVLAPGEIIIGEE